MKKRQEVVDARGRLLSQDATRRAALLPQPRLGTNLDFLTALLPVHKVNLCYLGDVEGGGGRERLMREFV